MEQELDDAQIVLESTNSWHWEKGYNLEPQTQLKTQQMDEASLAIAQESPYQAIANSLQTGEHHEAMQQTKNSNRGSIPVIGVDTGMARLIRAEFACMTEEVEIMIITGMKLLCDDGELW